MIMDVYTLLGKDKDTEAKDLGLAAYRLFKCYDFGAYAAEDPLEVDILGDKLMAVREAVNSVDLYVPGVYTTDGRSGISRDYFILLDLLERDTSLAGMQRIAEQLSTSLQANPGSVLYTTLSSIIMEKLMQK